MPAFNAAHSGWLRFSLYDFTGEEIRDAYRTLVSESNRCKWLPQSLGEQIWILLEFKDAEDRTNFQLRHEDLDLMIEDQDFFDQWTHDATI